MLHWTPRLSRDLKRPDGFIPTCQPTLAKTAPSGPEWLHEIKHDGYRLIARKDGDRVRLWTRWGNSWTRRAVEVAEAVRLLPVGNVVLDGEVLCPHEDGHSDSHALQSTKRCRDAQLIAFDLLMLDERDLRLDPLVNRRARLADLLASVPGALQFSECIEGNGSAVFRHACAMGLEGIVSKRKDSSYRSGRSDKWLKVKNPAFRRR
jgi:bifunctional non-homologous end joining protein LigD